MGAAGVNDKLVRHPECVSPDLEVDREVTDSAVNRHRPAHIQGRTPRRVLSNHKRLIVGQIVVRGSG